MKKTLIMRTVRLTDDDYPLALAYVEIPEGTSPDAVLNWGGRIWVHVSADHYREAPIVRAGRPVNGTIGPTDSVASDAGTFPGIPA